MESYLWIGIEGDMGFDEEDIFWFNFVFLGILNVFCLLLFFFLLGLGFIG